MFGRFPERTRDEIKIKGKKGYLREIAGRKCSSQCKALYAVGARTGCARSAVEIQKKRTGLFVELTESASDDGDHDGRVLLHVPF